MSKDECIDNKESVTREYIGTAPFIIYIKIHYIELKLFKFKLLILLLKQYL